MRAVDSNSSMAKGKIAARYSLEPPQIAARLTSARTASKLWSDLLIPFRIRVLLAR